MFAITLGKNCALDTQRPKYPRPSTKVIRIAYVSVSHTDACLERLQLPPFPYTPEPWCLNNATQGPGPA